MYPLLNSDKFWPMVKFVDKNYDIVFLFIFLFFFLFLLFFLLISFLSSSSCFHVTVSTVVTSDLSFAFFSILFPLPPLSPLSLTLPAIIATLLHHHHSFVELLSRRAIITTTVALLSPSTLTSSSSFFLLPLFFWFFFSFLFFSLFFFSRIYPYKNRIRFGKKFVAQFTNKFINKIAFLVYYWWKYSSIIQILVYQLILSTNSLSMKIFINNLNSEIRY